MPGMPRTTTMIVRAVQASGAMPLTRMKAQTRPKPVARTKAPSVTSTVR